MGINEANLLDSRLTFAGEETLSPVSGDRDSERDGGSGE